MVLDDFDNGILALLQANAALPQRAISDAVHLSPSAVNRRIAAMQEAGVIRKHTVLVDPAKVGRPITLIVEIVLESERTALLDLVRERLVACPVINQVYYVTGEADFVVVLTVADMEEYEALTRQLFFAEGNIKRFRTLVVMGAPKVGLEVPLPTDREG